MSKDRLRRQIEFLIEIDKLKIIFRNAFLAADPNRKENSAEHSWHTAMMALVLAEYAQEKVDSSRLVKMMLVHDLIEVYAGDTNIYDKQAVMDKVVREQSAAERVFGLLPEDQYGELIELWQDFEKGITPEAKFARALDRLIPLLHNYYTQGKRWKEDKITYEMALPVYRSINKDCPILWEYAFEILDKCISKDYFAKQ